jgi:hypothetical protein
MHKIYLDTKINKLCRNNSPSHSIKTYVPTQSVGTRKIGGTPYLLINLG